MDLRMDLTPHTKGRHGAHVWKAKHCERHKDGLASWDKISRGSRTKDNGTRFCVAVAQAAP